jgi:hypothetical protein
LIGDFVTGSRKVYGFHPDKVSSLIGRRFEN